MYHLVLLIPGPPRYALPKPFPSISSTDYNCSTSKDDRSYTVRWKLPTEAFMVVGDNKWLKLISPNQFYNGF